MNPRYKLPSEPSATPVRIVLPESSDPRVVRSALTFEGQSQVYLTLLCTSKSELIAAHPALVDAKQIELVEYKTSAKLDEYAALIQVKRAHKGLTLEGAQALLEQSMYYACAMVLAGHADGVVSGSMSTTADTLRPAMELLRGPSLASSFFIMEWPTQTLLFADCALLVDPSAQELADIAQATAESYQALCHDTPRVAMISYSTHGSGRGPSVDKVVQALRLAREHNPRLLIDGELQIDAALVPEVAVAKAPKGVLGGAANVLVFPNLDTGNSAYKIAQRLGGAHAIGPITQGLLHPVNDLSRGASVDDIVDVIQVTALQVRGGHHD